jgi:hypothetical protein
LVYFGIISKSYASEFYRWTDEDGTVHVSDVQPDHTLHKSEVKSIRGLPEPSTEEEMKAKDIKHPEYSRKEATGTDLKSTEATDQKSYDLRKRHRRAHWHKHKEKEKNIPKPTAAGPPVKAKEKSIRKPGNTGPSAAKEKSIPKPVSTGSP